mmetsp:Transcript_5570/g.5724  ORF Transcript_5570/g.5724 Transcript_5570/m.5724 type:complete len:107 (-) Transcript_5570:904-1224(-)
MGSAASIPLLKKPLPEKNSLSSDPNRQYIGNVLKLDGGTINEINELPVENKNQLKGASTGTDYIFLPDVLSPTKAGDVTKTDTHCSFVQPTMENATKGEFIYFVNR